MNGLCPVRRRVVLFAAATLACVLSVGQSRSRVVAKGKPIPPAVSFELDIQPILTAEGCNAGACHGKQRGQNGFQLSLLGFDPEFDFRAIVQDARGRRLFPPAPDASLLLQKATAAVPHGGGQRFDSQSRAFRLLSSWIGQGAPRRIPHEPALRRVELVREEFSFRPGETGSLGVFAHYSDGTRRDVTKMAAYLSNEPAIASVGPDGQIEAGGLPGETAIMARYMNHIRVAKVVIPRSERIPEAYFDDLPRSNFVDELVYAKWSKLGIRPSEPASDFVFLRRVYTDLIGRLPTADEARLFLDSESPARREELVDRLLRRPEYVDHWANQWADLLRPNPYRVGIKAVFNYDDWIRQQFRDDVRYDEFVRRLITASGSTWRNGAATLYRDRRSPDEVATLTSQLFLGVRLECAKCHHHPFEQWSQGDFYRFAAFFAKVGYKGTGLSPPISGGEEVIYPADRGEVRHPVTGEILAPAPLFGEIAEPNDDDPRRALAAWMTSVDNDFFAKVQVNRMWAALMGRGLVEPVDDLRSTNPPTHPELLDALATRFQSTGYDLKDLLKTIVLSRVYSLSSHPNASNRGDTLNYSRHYRHRLRAEVLMDAIGDVTETWPPYSAMPPNSRANQVWTHRIGSTFLDTFGRPDENQDPPCERLADATVTQALHLMNSPELNDRIRSDEGRAARLAAGSAAPDEIVDELYLAVFSRRPDEGEASYACDLIRQSPDRRGVIEDLLWAMINAPEFSIQN